MEERNYYVELVWRTKVEIRAMSAEQATTKAMAEFRTLPSLSLPLSTLPELCRCSAEEAPAKKTGVFLVESKLNKMPAFVCNTKEEAENALAECGYENDFIITLVPVI